ncbi:transposable element Tcb1 transposase [Trichonephila clavipes]|nr:transposable element Tcb1 transposase [Trichonephila clavipes]
MQMYFKRTNNPPGTTLTAFFTLCQEDAFARILLYSEVPSYYTWNETKKVFIRRRRGEPVDGRPGIFRENTLGRIYTVHPNQDECFYLRMLLVNVPGPGCFHELKIVDGVTHATFRKLWERYRSHMAEDILHRVRLENGNMAMEFTEVIYNETLIDIEDKGQTLPVISRLPPADEIHACLKYSTLWRHVHALQLTKNMRVQLQNDPSAEVFSRQLLDIGNGQLTIDETRQISLSDNFCNLVTSKEELISKTARGGRVRSTTPAEDRYIVLSAKRNRRTTAQQVANQFLAASGKQISRKTVVRRLRGGGLYARRPVVCVPLTRQHRTARLQWCREHHNWTEQDWACVLFSDESRFSLSSDCRRQLIWRESGTAYRPENIKEKDRYPTCSIMVWAGIMINGRTRLHVVANGTMTGQRYIDEFLLPHVRLFRGAVGDKFVFMDDNATCHRTLAVQDCLDSEGIQRLVWPARSPDLNPIENVWDALGRKVAGRNYPPTNKNTVIRALTEEWDKLPQQLLGNVLQSMVRRVECCITLHGGHIPY